MNKIDLNGRCAVVTGGAQGFFRIGNDLETNLLIGGEVLGAVQGDGYGIVDVSTREADLEDVFLNLTRAANG